MEPRLASPAQRAVLAALLLAGAALRLWQYSANTSLWIDEIALAENVIHAPLSSLLREPLALDQVASPGFLAVLKLATATLGPTEYALRLFSLLCGLASLGLFAAVAGRTRPGWTSVFATALFAFSPTLISYSAEAKQYSTDVCVSLALTLIALGLRTPRATGARLVGAALAGAAAVWLSQSAVFVVAGLGAVLALQAAAARRRKPSGRFAAMLGLWGASAAAAIAVGRRSLTPSTREYMQTFWQPSLPRPTVLILVLLASIVLWKRRPEAAPLFIGPAAFALAAAAAHLYPFSGRAILFLTPAGLLAAADGAGWIVEALGSLRVPQPVAASFFAVPLAIAAALHPPVYRNEESRPVLAKLAGRRQPGDAVYVYYGAERAVRFYGPRLGIAPSEAVFGSCHRGQPRDYLRELDQFRGRPRVWVVFSHGSAAEPSAMRGYLTHIGSRSAAFEAAGASAELYDLSDPARLQTTAADTFAVPEGNPDGARYGCGHGPLAPTPPDWK